MGRKDWAYVNLPKLLLKRMDKFLEGRQARQLGIFNKSELVRNLVNEFLLEQEKHYDGMDSIDEFISEVEYGDHLAIILNDEKQFDELVYAYAKRGIAMNAINVLLGNRIDEPRFLRALKQIKNVDSLFNSEEIFYLYTDDYFHDGRFYVKPLFKKLDDLIELAKNKSMKGLFVLGYFSGRVYDEGGSFEEVNSYESMWHEKAKENSLSVSVMCLYRSLSESHEERLGRCHHVILKRAKTQIGLQ